MISSYRVQLHVSSMVLGIPSIGTRGVSKLGDACEQDMQAKTRLNADDTTPPPRHSPNTAKG